MSIADFRISPLGDMVAVGNVSPASCRLWVRVTKPGRFRLEFWPAGATADHQSTAFEIPEINASDNTVSLQLPTSTNAPLTPSTRYEFRVERESSQELIGTGQFETAPDQANGLPDRFSIAVMSCHEPFQDDGSYDRRSLAMLDVAQQVLRQHDCKMVFTVGDQMYADVPPPLSLFDRAYFRSIAPPGRDNVLECSADEVRRLYHRRYRYYFACDAWQRIHASQACYPIWDDHEIVDNWGSVDEHNSPKWQALHEGARLAYFDYQASRVLDRAEHDHFGYQVVYGDIAVQVLDLRSNRAMNSGHLMSSNQFEEFAQFLEQHADKLALFVVLSVPAVHLSPWASKLGATLVRGVEDFSDRWSSPEHVADRDRIMKLLHKHQQSTPNQPIVLLSGDIHIGCVHQIEWRDTNARLFQLVSSPISHHRSWLEAVAAKLSIQMNRQITTRDKQLRAAVRRLPKTRRSDKNPYGGLNLGLVEFRREAHGWEMRFFLYGQDDQGPLKAYQSPPVVVSRPEKESSPAPHIHSPSARVSP